MNDNNITRTRNAAYREAEQKIDDVYYTGATYLSLNYNQLTALPEALGQLTQLQTLDLGGNQLTALPEALEKLKNLTKLDLGGNQLTALPEALGKLTNLTDLNLNHNQLTALPEALGQLKTLTELNLNDNQLTSLPESLGQLTNLHNLLLSDNQLTALPESLGQLTQLQRLDLSNNQLTALPESLGHLSQLQGLWLKDNALTALPESLGQITQLQTLRLSGNQLTVLPKSVGQINHLRGLNLARNQLTELPEWLCKIRNLQWLDLACNQLTTLPEMLGQIRHLRELNLAFNYLTSLPESLRKLHRLEKLYLHDNPGLGLPPDILGPPWEDGFKNNAQPAAPQAILDYYFRPKWPLNEAKLILVGFGKVGKTSLVKRLVEDSFDKDEEKTEGIKITQWPIALTENKDKVLLHVWDFGGQEIMHSTHQFFLSHRSLYLLVLNGRQGHEDADAEYWLNLIRSFGSDSPVIVVLNKQQEHPFDLNRQNLQSKFPGMIRMFVKSECDAPTQGMDDLKQAILRETGQLPGLRDGFPEEWFAIKDELASMTDNYLTFEQYRGICIRLGEETQMDQDRLAGYLHQLGVALNYKDDPRLRDMHILNPRWVTEGIYTILNAKELDDRKGELHIDCLDQILDPKNYPRERHLFLLNLMRKFHLCFEFPDKEGHYLVPDLADKNQPSQAAEFDPTECLNFQYKYPSLHEGVLPSFITRTYILSENHPRWRTGVILEFEGCRALVKGDLSERLVSISVTGPSPEARRRLLAVIRASFEDIHRNFEFKPKELVPVPGHPEVSIGYNKLRVFEDNRELEFKEVVEGKIIKIDVKVMLNGVDLEGERRPREEKRETKPTGVKLFYSYSHKDEALREELETHLTILKRQRLIQEWHDRRIVAGEEWEKEIARHLEEANIILLLVSADFIASDFCYDKEMMCAMERHKAGEVQVLPIILRESNWNGTLFAKLQAMPKDGKPVVAHERKDIAWTEISKRLEEIAKDMLSASKLRNDVE